MDFDDAIQSRITLAVRYDSQWNSGIWSKGAWPWRVRISTADRLESNHHAGNVTSRVFPMDARAEWGVEGPVKERADHLKKGTGVLNRRYQGGTVVWGRPSLVRRWHLLHVSRGPPPISLPNSTPESFVIIQAHTEWDGGREIWLFCTVCWIAKGIGSLAKRSHKSFDLKRAFPPFQDHLPFTSSFASWLSNTLICTTLFFHARDGSNYSTAAATTTYPNYSIASNLYYIWTTGTLRLQWYRYPLPWLSYDFQ